MAIADKLQTIAEKQQQVYDAGFAAGSATGGDTEEAYNNGFEAGKKAEQSDFWDIFQQNGNRKEYSRAFYSSSRANSGWNDDNYNPKYPIIVSGTSSPNTFWASLITDTKVPIIVRDNASAYGLFGSSAVHTVRKLVLEGTVFSWQYTFTDCGLLENITIEGNIYTSLSFLNSSKLTKESLMSIINALAVVSTTQTLTLNATAKARLTDEEKAIATNKGWTIA